MPKRDERCHLVHNALDDAYYQALVIQYLFKALGDEEC
jgi:hypothetical protein